MKKIILGIESSCDDTSVALVNEDLDIISLKTVSQTSVHQIFGGVIPEIASRNHIAWIIPAIDHAINESGIRLEDISALAVTNFPGLIGSLLIGTSVAKGLAVGLKKPVIAVNHLDAHTASAFLNKGKKACYPYLSLIVSGGHTSLIDTEKNNKIILGETIDDAAGEAFDKVAKMFNLGYPGGPVIDKLAQSGNKTKYNLPYLLKNNNKYVNDIVFSFSGIKSAVKRILDEGNVDIPSLMATFQDRISELIERKMKLALKRKKYSAVVFSGGVSANSEIRKRISSLADSFGIECFMPYLQYCQDNGAMVAAAAFEDFYKKNFASLDFDVMPTMRPPK